MKKLSLIVVFVLFFSGLGYSQQLVAIGTDSLSTEMFRAQERTKWLQDAANTVQQIQAANDTLQHQLKVFKNLSRGDVEGFIDAYSEQTKAVKSFSDTMDRFSFYNDKYKFYEMMESDEFLTAKDFSKDLYKSMASAGEVLGSTRDVVKNASMRAEKIQQARNANAGTDSTLISMEMVNRNLGEVDATLKDLLTTNAAYTNFIAVEQEYKEKQARVAAIARAEQIESLSNLDPDTKARMKNPEDKPFVFGSVITDEELYNNLTNPDFGTIGKP